MDLEKQWFNYAFILLIGAMLIFLASAPQINPLGKAFDFEGINKALGNGSQNKEIEQPQTLSETILEGELIVLHFDDFENNKSWEIFQLKDSQGKITELKFEKQPELLTGTQIRVKGILQGNQIAIKENDVPQIVSPPPQINSQNHSAVILLVNFMNDSTQPFTPQEINEFMFTNPDSVNSFYQENSFDQISFSGDVFGWYQLQLENITGFCNFDDIGNYADQIAAQQGININNYDHIIYGFPRIDNCAFGIGTIGGVPSRVWMNGFLDRVGLYSHELGHNLGNAHAASISCGDKAIDDYSNCTFSEYGDSHDVMGSEFLSHSFHFNLPHKNYVDFIENSQIQEVTTNGQYTINKLETSQSGTYGIKIAKPDTNQFYYVEYKQPIGFDSDLTPTITSGASIHIWSEQNYSRTYLVSALPGTNDSLIDGSIFFDEINNIKIKQISHNQDSVTIYVSFIDEIEQDSQTTILSHFNNDANADFALGSSIPTETTGTTIVQGIIGNGVLVDSTDRLSYSGGANIYNLEGTIEFWAKPTWNGNDNATHSFFSAKTTTESFEIKKWNSPVNNSLASFSLRPGTVALVSSPITNWTANSWHHVAVSWKSGTNGSRKLYIDGTLVSTLAYADSYITTYDPTNIRIGWSGNPIVSQANATIDELKISNIQRTSQEIFNDYAKATPALPITNLSYIKINSNQFVITSSLPIDTTSIRVDYPENPRENEPNYSNIRLYNNAGEQLQTAIDPLPTAYSNLEGKAFAFHHEEQGCNDCRIEITGIKDLYGRIYPDLQIRI
ncbi:MAG: LamG-like jellyroll fold domain-containing protein [archaeon]|nr:LamG-like jellyroll fold domain-containing protein [archaeon]